MHQNKNLQIARIKEMEEIYDKVFYDLANFKSSLHNFSETQKNLKKLDKYYWSKNWLKDFEDDNNWKIPKNIKRWVLAEDTLYNLFLENKEIAEEMVKIGNRILKI